MRPHCARCSANTMVNNNWSVRVPNIKVGSTLTKQTQEGCFPHQHPFQVHLLTDSNSILLQGAQLFSCCCPELGRRTLYPTASHKNIQGLLVCHLLNMGALAKAPGSCRNAACPSPRGRTHTSLQDSVKEAGADCICSTVAMPHQCKGAFLSFADQVLS